MREPYEKVYNDYLEKGFILDDSKDVVDSITKHTEKLNCHCKKHLTKLMIPYSSIISGRCSCPECRKEIGRHNYTIEEKKEILLEHKLKYVKGDLSKVLNPVLLECENGHLFERCFNNVNRGEDDCPYCNEHRVPSNYWSIDKMQEWIDINLPGYKILDAKYENKELRVFIKCPDEQHEPYWTSWNHVYHDKSICRECYYVINNKTHWDKYNIDPLLDSVGLKILNRDDYVSSQERFAAYDNLGFIYMVRIHNIVRGRKNFHPFKNNPYAVHNIKLFCKLYRPDYEFVSEKYLGSNSIHKWRYLGDSLPPNENREFEMEFGRFYKSLCNHPALSRSRLESKCKYILEKYNLQPIMQKTFDGCVYKNKLRFDFYFIYNGKEYCIETDGKQHKYPVSKFGGFEAFKELQIKDEIKTNYCNDNNIALLRIPEEKFKDMEDMIVNFLELEKID